MYQNRYATHEKPRVRVTHGLPEVTWWQNQVSEVESILTVDEKERPDAPKSWCLLLSEERGVRCLDPYLEAENF